MRKAHGVGVHPKQYRNIIMIQASPRHAEDIVAKKRYTFNTSIVERVEPSHALPGTITGSQFSPLRPFMPEFQKD